MASLEIRDPDFFLPTFEDLSVRARTMPSLIMISATTKFVFFSILNILIFVSVTIAGWRVASGEKHAQILRTVDFEDTARINPAFRYSNQTPAQVNLMKETADDENRM